MYHMYTCGTHFDLLYPQKTRPCCYNYTPELPEKLSDLQLSDINLDQWW